MRPTRSDARCVLLALGSGVLLALAFPGPGLWPLAFVAHAPLLLALDGAKFLRAVWIGWLAYAALALLVCRFLWVPLRVLGDLPWATAAMALGLLAALQGLRGAILGGGMALLGRLLPLPSAFLVAFLASEHVPLIFSWSLAGVASGFLPLAQSASLGGAPLVALWIAAASLPLATLLARKAGRPWPWRWAWGPLLGLGLALVWGRQRLEQLSQEERQVGWSVGLVHGAIPLNPDAPPELEGWLSLRRAALDLERRGARLVVLPETALPLPVRWEHLEEELRALGVEGERAAWLVGALVEEPRGVLNGALLVEEGSVQVAGKRVLLPFGEYIPLERWMPWLRGLSPRTARLTVPWGEPEVRLDGHRLGLSICYEGVMSERVRVAAGQGEAELLLNLSNDAWFAETQEPALHAAQTRLRAVELGRYLVRSTNQGHTMVVGPSGRLLAEAAGTPTQALLVNVLWRRESTVFARWGAWGGGMGLLGFLVLLGCSPRGTPARGRVPWERRRRELCQNLGGGMFSARNPKASKDGSKLVFCE
ncbi:MAG: apolipoprotein N-acyltransferase [Myxococcales bacterium]|nr:apolipoprotein N-acyltransferase [Polyangiaceae bacterium]MDW8250275.1 apolipoprotein N-acyltransferase [Myxococcales bacterium]